MKKFLLHSIILIMSVMAAGSAKAQLPSEKPMKAFYSKPVQAKLDAPKHGNRQAQLPSEARLPSQVSKAAVRVDQNRNAGLTPEQKAKKLPSNSKNRTPLYKKPRRL